MQLRRHVHHTLIRVLPASRSPAVQEGLQLHELLLLPFPPRLCSSLAMQFGCLIITHGLRQYFDQSRLVLRRHFARDHESKRGVQRRRAL